MVYDVFHYPIQNLRFRQSKGKQEAGVFKNLHRDLSFENLRFWCQKTPFIRVDEKGYTEEKSLRVPNYPDTCDRCGLDLNSP